MIGALGFLNPWLLLALAALPALYWLLRTVPPRPRTIAFPPTRMLKDLENKQQTPARTPWWLMLIRMAAAALVIAALAEPVLNPKRAGALTGDGPMVLVVDNTWAAASKWPLRTDMMAALIAEADSAGRAIVLAATANPQRGGGLKLDTPKAAREAAAALRPEPWAPRRADVVPLIEAALSGKRAGKVVWLTDGLDHGAADKESAKDTRTFLDGLARLAGDGRQLIVFRPGADEEPLGLASQMGAGGKLTAEVKRAEGNARAGLVQAWSARGQRLGEAPFQLGTGATSATVALDLPLELRNQVTRLDIAGLKSAGAVSLLDSRSRWHRVGLVASTSREQAQPLLAPLYYITKALGPFMELIQPRDAEVPAAIEQVVGQNASTVMLADVGKLPQPALERLTEWVAKGGVLVRFAGPRLEQGGDDLLPAALRTGGRTLGGALSWATPQPVADFEPDSLFAGLAVPADVLVSRQVLADPGRLGPQTRIWARLKDGTPLVTAAKRGEGWMVLFHVTANSDWSNLPLSGLFVEMLRRVVALTGAVGEKAAVTTAAATASDTVRATAAESTGEVLAPVETLNGYGDLGTPPATAQAIRISQLGSLRPSAESPPGLYGPAATARALNLFEPKSTLAPLPGLPSGTAVAAYQAEKARPLKPELLALALALLFTDILAVVALQMGLSWPRKAAPATPTTTAAIVALAIVMAAISVSAGPADAQTGSGQSGRQRAAPTPQPPAPESGKPGDEFSLRAALRTRLAYVLTGDPNVDQTSRQGLAGLTQMLTQRTAIEPADPVGIDVARDELAFFPVLYWPVLATDKALPALVQARVDTYMKQGGLIIFDTRDAALAMPQPRLDGALQGPGAQALQRLVGALDVPRLEPVPEAHVLTKSFYLLKSFPGRWDGGQMWVEATVEADKSDPRRARRADGVSSIIITANDFAAAWAIDPRGRPAYAVVPGGEPQREMAYRTGINIVMYALTGNYKADQVHVPALLERLGQ